MDKGNHIVRLSRRQVVIGLIFVSLLGACLRFYHLRDVSPRIGDEANYLLESRHISSVISTFWRSGRLLLEERTKDIEIKRRMAEAYKNGTLTDETTDAFKKELTANQGVWKKDEQFEKIRSGIKGLPLRYGRITHEFLIAIANLLLGPLPYTGILISAIFGTLTIPLVFLLGRTMYGEKTGLVAALLFAVMGYHIQYSRTGLAEATSLFFLAATMLYYYKSRWSSSGLSLGCITLSGLLLGIGFTAHNRLLLMFFLLLVMEIHLYWGKKKVLLAENILFRLFFFSFFFLLPSFLWETVYHLFMIVLRQMSLALSEPTYAEQMMRAFWHSLLWGILSKSYRLSGFLTFPYLFQFMCGILFLFILILGLFCAIRRHRPADVFLCVWFLFPYVLYSLTTAGVTRFFSMILAPAAVLMALAFSKEALPENRWTRWIRTHHRSLVLGVGAIVVMSGIWAAFSRVVSNEDRIASSHDFLHKRGVTSLISVWGPFSQIYMGVDNVAYPPRSEAELRDLYEKGFRHFLVDGSMIVFASYQKDIYEVISGVMSHGKPIYDVFNPLFPYPQYLFEANLYFWDTLEMIQTGSEHGLDRIRIYDLQLHFPGEGTR